MKELKLKKVRKSWEYEVSINGEPIPFISKVEIKTDDDGFAKAFITIILANSSEYQTVIEDNMTTTRKKIL